MSTEISREDLILMRAVADSANSPHMTQLIDRVEWLEQENERLLSLVKSQEAVGGYSKLAHEIISEYNSADDPGLLRSKVAEGFRQVATSMRSACVEKVKSIDPMFVGKWMDSEWVEIDRVITALESVSIQEQK